MYEVGTVLPCVEVRITRAGVVRYAGASTDFNDIHFSDRRAHAIGLPGVVAHGMWTMGLALRVVTEWIADPARVRSYQVRFTRPVIVPDTDEGTTLRCGGTITALDDDTITISVSAETDDGAVLGAARVRVAR